MTSAANGTPGTVTTSTAKLTISGTLAPGAAAGQIGMLTLNAGGLNAGGTGVTRTAGTALLAFNSGSSLSITLGAGNTSSSLALINTYTGEVSFNGTTVNFTNAAGALSTGLYTLVSADAANAYTGLTTNGTQITGGLTIGTGLNGYTSDLELNGNNIQLNITAVPEPATMVQMAVLGFVCVGWFYNRRRLARRA